MYGWSVVDSVVVEEFIVFDLNWIFKDIYNKWNFSRVWIGFNVWDC